MTYLGLGRGAQDVLYILRFVDKVRRRAYETRVFRAVDAEPILEAKIGVKTPYFPVKVATRSRKKEKKGI